MAIKSLILVLAVWLAVAETQDGVQPLTLLETSEFDAATPTQKVISKLEEQNQKLADQKQELESKVEVQKIDMESTAAGGDGEMLDASEAKVVLKPDIKVALQQVKAAESANSRLRQELNAARAQQQQQEQKVLEDEEQKATMEVKSKFAKKREEAPAANKYKAIPYFVFKLLSKKVDAESMDACRNVCDAQPKCKSYSWDANEKGCWWSVEKLTYDDNYHYAAKVRNPPAGEPQQQWSDTPGLRWTTPGSKNLYKVSLQECKEACMQEGSSCNAVSYKLDTNTCIKSDEALPTNKHATYYEKKEGALEKEEADAIATARSKLKAEYNAKETASKAMDKAEEEKQSREASSKRATREAFIKRQPSQTEERRVKKKVENQVRAEKMRLQEASVKAQEKEEMEEQRRVEAAKEKSLKHLQLLEERQQKAEKQVKAAADALKKDRASLTAAKKQAQATTTTLDTKLQDVTDAHERAMQALMTFKSARSSDADPEMQNSAKLSMQQSHTALSAAIHAAELSHTKEAAAKKGVQDQIAKEAHASTVFQGATEALTKLKKEGKQAVEREEKRVAAEALKTTKEKYELARTQMSALRAKEAAAKQAAAKTAGKIGLLEYKMKHTTTTTGQAENEAMQEQLSALHVASTKDNNVLSAAAQDIKASLKKVMEAKSNYETLMESQSSEKKPIESQDQQIEDAEAQLEGNNN